MIQFGRFGWAALAVASLSYACGGGSDSKGYVRPTGRGSAACQAWQKALCDYATLECKSNLTEQTCVNEYYGISCLSDATAQSCATALESATCTTMPANCNVPDIADPTPAFDACNEYIDTMCTQAAACGAVTHDQCVTDAQNSMDCSTVNSVGLNYETCIDDLKHLSCTAAALPTSCKGVIISIQ